MHSGSRCSRPWIRARLLVLLISLLLVGGSSAPAGPVRRFSTSSLTGLQGYHPAQFSPDGRYLAAGTDTDPEGVEIWDVQSRKRRHFLTGAGVSSLCFSPDGRTLATGRRGEFLSLWDVGSGKLRWKRQPKRTLQDPRFERGHLVVLFDPSGNRLLTLGGSFGRADEDHRLRWWDAATGEPLEDAHAEGVLISPSGEWLCVVAGSREAPSASLVSTTGGEVRKVLRGVGSDLWSQGDTAIGFTWDGLLLNRNGRLSMLELPSLQERSLGLKLQRGVATGPGRTVVEFADAGTVLVDYDSGRRSVLGEVFVPHASPDDRLLVAQGRTFEMGSYLWSAMDMARPGSSFQAYGDLVFSPDCKVLAINGSELRLLDLPTLRPLATLRPRARR